MSNYNELVERVYDKYPHDNDIWELLQTVVILASKRQNEFMEINSRLNKLEAKADVQMLAIAQLSNAIEAEVDE